MNTPNTKPGSAPQGAQQSPDPRSEQPKDRPPGQMTDKDKGPKSGSTGQQGGAGGDSQPSR